MSKEHSTQLWNAVQDSLLSPSSLSAHQLTRRADDVASFNAINTKLLNQTASPLRHIPLRIYIPSQTESDTVGSFKIVQSLVTPRTANRKLLYL
jgi:autophagy-related protein 5